MAIEIARAALGRIFISSAASICSRLYYRSRGAARIEFTPTGRLALNVVNLLEQN